MKRDFDRRSLVPVHNDDMSPELVKFGDGLEFDRTAYELRRLGRSVKLERIPMEILLLLIDRRGELISRGEIIEKIWGNDVFFDTDNSINSAIRKIRQVLKDDPENPAYIQTVTGKGYRFIAEIVDLKNAPITAMAASHEAQLSEAASAIEPKASATSPQRRWTAGLAALVVLIAIGSPIVWLRSTRVAAPHRVMLAVLPFTNLSDDREQEYFSDGLTEETITDLGEINPEQLGVIARASSAAYKRSGKTISEIGRELKVDYVLEGSVRRENGAARVSAQLVRVKDQAHLWTHTYDRESGGQLALQSELGRAIAQLVQVKLAASYGTGSISQYAANPEAYELYLKGRFLLNKRTWPELPASTELFKRAVEKDPGFALAYAGLADSYLAQAIRSQLEFDPEANSAALRALELDGNLAEAHVVLGSVKADFEYDWAGAEKEFKRAIELEPNYADAHYRYAWHYLTPLGRSDEAIAEMEKALELDPFSRIDNTIFGCVLFYARSYDRAEEQFYKSIQLNPDFFVTYYHAAWLYSQTGQYAKAISAITRGRLLSGDDRVKSAAADEVALKKAFASDGAKGFWQQFLRVHDTGEFGTPQIYARLGEKEKALQGLQQIYEEREALGTLVNVDPAFDDVRSDPRFQSLVKRMGLS